MTVVDAANLLGDSGSHDFLRDHGASLGEADQRTIIDLLVDQVEFADLPVGNNSDLVDAATLARVRGVIQALNPKAKAITTTEARVPFNQVLDTGLFDFVEAETKPGW